MSAALTLIPPANLLFGFVPVVLLLAVMHRWRVGAVQGIYASGRMLAQLLAVGYLLTYVFSAQNPYIVLAVVTVMIGVSAWIAIRPLQQHGLADYGRMLAAIGTTGLPVLVLVTQGVLDLPRWYEPSVVVPLAGMVFANAMNTASLAAERLVAETGHGVAPDAARPIALEAALIPQINALLAVGLVSLPGMMTGQILSGVDPLIAVRYQIMVMCMIFGSGGLAAALYLALRRAG